MPDYACRQEGKGVEDVVKGVKGKGKTLPKCAKKGLPGCQGCPA